MVDLHAASLALGAIALFAIGGWLLSLARRDVSIVDSLWSLFFLLAVAVYAVNTTTGEPRATVLLVLVTLWALRLAGYLTWRNWGEPEDRRYREIRGRNEPGFQWKSLYLIFLLQAVLATLITAPLYAALSSTAPLSLLDYAGIALFLAGFIFETVGDYQLARFKADPANHRRVLDTGLWRYTRHPNYFGEAVVWWGLYLIAVGAGGWWTVFGPLLITFLLLKVSGVTLLEKDIGERRPDYRDYVARTNAFLPGPPRPRAGESS
jgi:steroid 5-alpha reductase family enzyme